MRRLLLIILLSVIFSLSCVPKNLPPELKPAFTANEVLIRIQELQTLTINLYDSNTSSNIIISKTKADLIVKFTIAASEIVRSSLNGWVNILKQSWVELNRQLEFNIPSNLKVAWDLTSLMILSL